MVELREVRPYGPRGLQRQNVDFQEGLRRLEEEIRNLKAVLRRREEQLERKQRALEEAMALTPRARELFYQWRDMGRSAVEALDEVRRSGIEFEERVEAFFRRAGL